VTGQDDPKEYRRFAAECAAAARQAADPQGREIFIRMERAWLRLAEIADKRLGGAYLPSHAMPDDSGENGHEA
jgi:hypothetical protein